MAFLFVVKYIIFIVVSFKGFFRGGGGGIICVYVFVFSWHSLRDLLISS